MRTAGIWALGIASGGLLLGLLLGSAAVPEMKQPPAPWWQQDDDGSPYRPARDRSASIFAQTETGTASSIGGYRPDLDYTAEVWSPRLPDSELAPLSDEYDAYFAYEEAAANRDTRGAEEAADNAEAAVEEAYEANHASAAPEVRKSELARTGLY